MRSNEKGYSSIEFILVLFLLMMFTLGALVLTKNGSELYKRMTDSKDDQTDIRIASAYISNKLRQSDAGGNIRVEALGDGGKALVMADMISGGSYETWIFSDGTSLRESLVPKGGELDAEASFEIVSLSRIDPQIVENSTVIVGLGDPEKGDIQIVYKIKSVN